MSMINKNTALAGVLAFAAKTAAHGIVTGIVADGTYNLGYDPSFKYQQTPPSVAGWSIPDVGDRGFVSDLNGPDIICHRGATPGQAYVQVAAGGKLEFQWTEWPVSHHGPVIDYLAPCGDDCTTVEKESLKFIKVAEAGLVEGLTAPNHWASDELIANNNTWSVEVPSDIAPGKYVWRHETIALHSAHEDKGAQPYPQCVNVEITGSGTDDLSGGISAEEFYSWSDAGIKINIYYPEVKSYTIPGPPLREGGKPGSSPVPSSGDSLPTGLPTGGYGNATILPTGGSPAGPTGGKPTGVRPTGVRPTGTRPTTTSSVNTDIVEASSVSSTTTADVQPTGPPIKVPVDGGEAEPAPSSTSPISFTSTFTGRIGKPTKFTCYIEE